MKKSKMTSRSSAKTRKSAVKKTTAAPKKTGPKAAKTASSSKDKKKDVKEKVPVPGQKASALRPLAPVSPARTSLKKGVAGKTTITAKKSEPKKPLEKQEESRTRPSKPTAAIKPIAVKSDIKKEKLPKTAEIKKTAKGIASPRKTEKSSLAVTKGKKTPGKELVKPAGGGKAALSGTKPVRMPAGEKAVPKSRIPQKKTLAPSETKAASDKKRAGALDGKAAGSTAERIKGAAVAEGMAKEKKSPATSLKTAVREKPSPGKSLPRTRETAKQETGLKAKTKTAAPPSASRKIIKKKEPAASIAVPEAFDAMRGKRAETFTVHPQAAIKPRTSPKLKIFLPDEDLPTEDLSSEELPPAPSPSLPEEYGENELLLMEVDPSIVFVSWEIKPEDIAHETGKLTLRVYDVTGIDFDSSPANRFFDISLENRVDSKFIDIKMPGRDVVMEVGVLQPDGAFKPIRRSNQVSMPELQALDEFGITGTLPDTDTPLGY